MREWLRELRGSKTNKEFGESIGLSEQYYWMVENGYRQKRMSVDLISRIAKVTGKSVKKLVEAEDAYRANH